MNSFIKVKRGYAEGKRTKERGLIIYMFLGRDFVLSQCRCDGTNDVRCWEGSAHVETCAFQIFRF